MDRHILVEILSNKITIDEDKAQEIIIAYCISKGKGVRETILFVSQLNPSERSFYLQYVLNYYSILHRVCIITNKQGQVIYIF